MGFRNKIRNIQMFGLSGYIPRKSQKVVLVLVLIAISFVAGKVIMSDNSNEITGMVVENTITEESKDLQPSTTEDLSQDTTQDELDYEIYDYYEYGTECSYDIKQAEDDVADIKSYLGENEEKYKKLEEEYNLKIKEYEDKLQTLKDDYEIPIQLSKDDADEDEKDLSEAQNKLKDLQETCAY